MNKTIKKLADAIRSSHRITVLTGAGISTESGIPDFRSTEGLWTKNVSRMDMMSTSFLKRYPEQFWPAFKDIFRVKLEDQIRPNRGHYFFAELEKAGKEVSIITQNVDGLHKMAGSRDVLEIHGTIKEAWCPNCGARYDVAYVKEREVPRCQGRKRNGDVCNNVIRPGVVLFGDMVEGMEEAIAKVESSNLFMVLGSSLEVNPVNQLPRFAAATGQTCVIINRESTGMDKRFDIVLHADIGPTLAQIAKEIGLQI
jgi:NAD-dependent deacetylase